jgi:hypothetical protein
MEKRTSRRSTNYGKTNEERQFKDEIEEKNGFDLRKNSSDSDTDSLIADMAQGFIQAQAKVTNNVASFNNKDIISLLEKVNNQLEEIKNANDDSKKDTQTNGTSNNNASSSKKSTQDENSTKSTSDNKGQSDKELLTELKTLVSAMLQGKNNDDENSSKSQNTNNKKSNMNQQQNSMAAQTVSQVLAQTQYELANELENSLQKLRQVINKSEKIATNISQLLGEENIKKS